MGVLYDILSTPFPKAETIEEYIEAKLQMMIKEMKIRLDTEEVAYLRSLKSEVAVDNAARTIILKHWEVEDDYDNWRKSKICSARNRGNKSKRTR